MMKVLRFQKFFSIDHISAMSADHDITDNLRAAEEKYPQNATIDETLSEGGELPHLHLRRIRIGPVNKGNRIKDQTTPG